MKTYFLTGLSRTDSDVLSSAGLGHVLTLPGHGDGFLVEQANLGQCVTVLGATSTEEKPCGIDGVVVATLRFESRFEAPLDRIDPQHEQYRQAYIRACSVRHGDVLAAARHALVEQRARVELLQSQLVAEARAAKLQGSRISPHDVSVRTVLESELEELLQMPKVKEVQVEHGAIVVYTDRLFYVDTRSQLPHDIGEFTIYIFMQGQSDCVRWYNASRRITAIKKAQQAPNVFASGRAAMADIREVLPELIARMQFAAVARLAIEFIEQINVNEPAGASVTSWPLVQVPHAQISERAAQIWWAAGSPQGADRDCWLIAEHQLRQEFAQRIKS